MAGKLTIVHINADENETLIKNYEGGKDCYTKTKSNGEHNNSIIKQISDHNN